MIAAEQEKAEDLTRFKMLANGAKTVLQYWLVDGKDWPDLRQIAIKLFSMATSTTASERNFSTIGFIHSKLRNCLNPRSVDKLTFIKSNLPAFYDYVHDEFDVDDDSDSESSQQAPVHRAE